MAPPRAVPAPISSRSAIARSMPLSAALTSAPALEARGRLCLECEFLAGSADAPGIEERAFEHDGFRRAAHFGNAATHDAGHSLRFVGVGDDQHLRIERTIDAVERLDAFAFHRAADADLSAGQLLQIEGVHRLAEFDQHVVGDVHHVVDGPHACGLQPGDEPGGRGRDRDIRNGRSVPRTQVRRLERDGDIGRGFRGQGLRDERFHRQRVRGSYFAREADDAECIGPVGGDLKIEHGIWYPTGDDDSRARLLITRSHAASASRRGPRARRGRPRSREARRQDFIV